jgi:hypothetical protein
LNGKKSKSEIKDVCPYRRQALAMFLGKLISKIPNLPA